DSLEVTHFSHQHNIGVFAQGGFEPSGKRTGIGRNFTLSNGALLVVMHELDRLLDRHDMFCKVLIDIVDQRSLRGGFAGAGGARDQPKPAAYIRELSYNQRNPQFFERSNPRGNKPKRRAVTV